MQLATADGRMFSLVVDRYEFPDEDLGPTDDNPADEFETGRDLIVTVSFTNADGSWRASGPIMTTTQLERLADWFESLARGSRICNGIYFTERDLELSIDEIAEIVSVHAFRDFLPPWSTSPDGVTIEFPLWEIDAVGAAKSLRAQLFKFPGRPPLDHAK